jgi:CBS domain-containing protein
MVMHAADVVETLPTARLDDAVLPAVRMVSQRNLPGLVVADDGGQVVACVSSADLLRLVLPRYMRDDPFLARVCDEAHADRIAGVLVGTPIRDVITEVAGRVPVARADATIVELAELMARECCTLVLVENDEGRTLGIVTANHLLEVLVAATEEPA